MTAHYIPDSWERKLGSIPNFLESKNSTARLERTQEILDNLMGDEELRDLNYKLFLFPLGTPNAVAIPGGSIGVSDSLLDQVESDIGLAFVIAHELGHHHHRHVLRALGRSLFLRVGASAFGQTSSAIDSALSFTDKNFSRKQEREADDFAIRLIYKKYGTTEGALEFFNWIIENNTEHGFQQYFGSHPLTKDRIKTLKALAEELEQAKLSS